MQNNKHLIALDLDGTLLNDKKKIGFFDYFHLRRLSKKGNMIVLCTGRPIRATIQYYKKLKLNTYCSCYNGARIATPTSDEIFSIRKFDKNVIIEILGKLDKYISSYFCEDDTKVFTNSEQDFGWLFFKNSDITITLGEAKNILDVDPYICIMKFSKDDEVAKQKVVETLSQYPNIGLRFWGGGNICDLYYKDVHKAQAILDIAKQYNIPEDNIIAFGDSDNDFEMIETFKNGIAMKNGLKSLVEKSKNVTYKDNNHNGVSNYLKKNFKL